MFLLVRLARRAEDDAAGRAAAIRTGRTYHRARSLRGASDVPPSLSPTIVPRRHRSVRRCAQTFGGGRASCVLGVSASDRRRARLHRDLRRSAGRGVRLGPGPGARGRRRRRGVVPLLVLSGKAALPSAATARLRLAVDGRLAPPHTAGPAAPPWLAERGRSRRVLSDAGLRSPPGVAFSA